VTKDTHPHLPPSHHHFIGICGTAMAAVASLLKHEGLKVTGSDEGVYPPMSTFLEDQGIGIAEGYLEKHLKPKPDMIIVGNAISRGNPELEYVLDTKIPYQSLPECLKNHFLRDSHNLVVTGTHGKTTTTSLLAWLMEYAGKQPSFFVGGIPLNFGTGCRHQRNHLWVLEGDEYDTAFFDKRSKFLHYLPELVIINNIEFDHADIFASLEAIKTSFRQLVNIVPGNGMIVVNADDPHALEVTRGAQAALLEVGFGPSSAIRIESRGEDARGSHFRLLDYDFEVPLYGRHNIHNAAMAIVAAHNYHVPLDVIAAGLKEFRGIKRRQEVRGDIGGITVIDDFGHHPTAIRETINALRLRYPQRRIWALFEPRSNTTRRAVFQDDLAVSLGLADEVYIGPVARLEQLPEDNRLDVARLASDLVGSGTPARHLSSTADILEDLIPRLSRGDIVAVLSNGSFDGLIEKLLVALEGAR
jgi:UDP-N-acetylmuramate: L-alanyl-gamma-D-glutamyl-meso-diaminopimelate ligase